MKQLKISSGWIIYWEWFSEKNKVEKPFIGVFSGKAGSEVKVFIERYHLATCRFSVNERFSYGKAVKEDDKIAFSARFVDRHTMECRCGDDPFVVAKRAKNIRLQKGKDNIGIIKYTTYPEYKKDNEENFIITTESRNIELITNEKIEGVD